LASDIVQETKLYFAEFTFENTEAEAMAKTDSAKTVYQAIINQLQSIDVLTKEKFKELMKTVQSETGFKGKELWMPYRIGITGMQHGPDIATISELFGKGKIINRLQSHL
ncbi:MAG: glutamate--tRNA ligase, partial [Calditrichaeota bacterium]|nr:glutamate--tRNA ligase [Calditrichota bacterium]